MNPLARTDFVTCLKLANEVFEQYKKDQPKWWRKMDGTPILGDVAVRMAEKFLGYTTALEPGPLVEDTKLLLKRAADALSEGIPLYPNGELVDNANPIKQLKIDLIRELRKAAQ